MKGNYYGYRYRDIDIDIDIFKKCFFPRTERGIFLCSKAIIFAKTMPETQRSFSCRVIHFFLQKKNVLELAYLNYS